MKRSGGNPNPLGLQLRFILAAAALVAADSRPDVDIPVGSPVVEALRRAQTRTGRVLYDQAFPQLESRIPSEVEAAFSPFDSAIMEARLKSRRPAAFTWSDTSIGANFHLSPTMEIAYDYSSDSGSDDNSMTTGVGLAVYGNLFPRLAFYSRGSVYTQYTDKAQFTHQFNPDFGETYSVEKGANDSLLKNRSYNRYEHYLLLDLPRVTLKAGRDRLHLGPGYFSSLTADRSAAPYYLMEARIDFAPWLTLDDYVLRMTDTRHGLLKYANIHRFEFKPTRTLALAFQDIVIYQDRDLDWRYVLPLTPLAFQEDNLGGGDNDAMGFDFLFAGIPMVSVWGELFVDDLLGPTSFFDDFWENRWAGLAGFQTVSPWNRFDADLIVEISHVEPWTYIGRTPQTGFKHFDRPSASKLGPDSRSLDIQAAYRPFPWLEVKERFEANDKGMGRQATLGVVHSDSLDGTSKEFLGGGVRKERLLHHSAVLRWRRYLEAELVWIQEFGDRYADRLGLNIQAMW